MSRRVFVFIIALICFFGALLLLSALINAPAATDAVAEEPPVARSISAYVSMPPTPASESVASSAAWLRIAALFAFVIVIVPCMQCTCDANGRVLIKRRYVRCFHLVFKQEIACG
jgi:hypothetical protein